MSALRNAARAWLGIPTPPKPLLWPVHRHDGALYGVVTDEGAAVLAFFISPQLAERFVLERGLEQHLVGSAMSPEQVVRVCDASIAALMDGASGTPEAPGGDVVAFPNASMFDGVANPLPLSGEPFAYWPIAQFRAMAEASARG